MTRLAPNGTLSQDKLEQAILYFIHNMNNDMLGTTKLLKLIYYADFDHFEFHDTPITGARYVKFPHGPVPVEAVVILGRMAERGTISREDERCIDVIRTRYTANKSVDRAAFLDEEWQTLKAVSDRFLQWNAAQIVAASHGEAPWIAVRMGEDIPYELAYYRNTHGGMTTSDDFDRGDAPLRSEEEVFSTEFATV